MAYKALKIGWWKEALRSRLSHVPGVHLFILLTGLALWFQIYRQLAPFASWFVEFLPVDKYSHLGNAMQFFIYDTPKVLMLLVLIVFFVGVLRSFVTVDWTRRTLARHKGITAYVLAALLGVITPFCSCSAVPLFMGFVTAGIPLGITFAFLVSAPMVNEIALVMLFGLLGWKVALLYFVTGVSIAIGAGVILGKMELDHLLEEWVLNVRAGQSGPSSMKMSWPDRIRFGIDAVRDIVGRVWLYVVIGIAVGATIHGYVPEGYLSSLMGRDNWWSVPVSILVGVPMYANAAGVIPVVEALLGKGASLGTVIAFMMSVIALSLPEMIILRKVLKPKLIILFAAVVATGILCVGYLFNSVI